MREFTLNISHDYLREVVAPCLCLITGTRLRGLRGHDEGEEMLYVGVIKSKQVTATLDTRIKVERTARVTPSASQLAGVIQEARAAERFATRLTDPSPVTKLSPKLSAIVVDTIAKSRSNHGALRMVSAGLEPPPVDPSARLQGDAIDMALKVLGLSGDAPTAHLELVKGKETGRRLRLTDAQQSTSSRCVNCRTLRSTSSRKPVASALRSPLPSTLPRKTPRD